LDELEDLILLRRKSIITIEARAAPSTAQEIAIPATTPGARDFVTVERDALDELPEDVGLGSGIDGVVSIARELVVIVRLPRRLLFELMVDEALRLSGPRSRRYWSLDDIVNVKCPCRILCSRWSH
jgi:hypothetical protein